MSTTNTKTTTTTIDSNLCNLRTGCIIRPATEAELLASIEAAEIDGGHGVIEVEIDGEMVACYCD